MKIIYNSDLAKINMNNLLVELFPLPRTIVSDGYDKSIEIIKKILPFNVKKFKSGTDVWGWKVPNKWNIKEGYISKTDGTKILDYYDNNLRISPYSKNVKGIFSKNELFEHLNYSELMPEAIPYNTLYYKNDWQFNVTKSEYNNLFKESEYKVNINVDSEQGELKIGQIKKEIIISTYMCHPSMANDNLSGVVAAVELFRALSTITNPYYSYRLIILPETVGAICYLSDRGNLSDVFGGYVLYICGDGGDIVYKRSYQQNTLIDKAAELALNTLEFSGSVTDFQPFGSDERQYNAPGVRLPFGAVTRTEPGKFSEYHTSADDLYYISLASLENSVSFMIKIISILEKNILCKNLFKGEPFFSKYGLSYPTFHNASDYYSKFNFKRIAYEIDGRSDAMAISSKLNIEYEEVVNTLELFIDKGLAIRINNE